MLLIVSKILFFVFLSAVSVFADSEEEESREGLAPVLLVIFSDGYDLDGDGLTNGEERSAGSSLSDEDTDGDGLSDFQEIKEYKTNTNRSDTDSDGLSDFAEISSYKTDPLVSDSDADGLSDGVEVLDYGTNPLSSDTDGDSRSDGDEVGTSDDPLDDLFYNSAQDGLSG